MCDGNMENLTYFVYMGDFGTFVATAVLQLRPGTQKND